MQRAERIEHEAVDPRRDRAALVASQLPVARDAAPRGPGLEQLLAAECVAYIRGRQRCHREQLASAAEQRRARIHHQSLHHALARSRDRQRQTGPLGVVIDEVLQHARQLGSLQDEVRDLIEHQRPGPLGLDRALGDAGQQGRPSCHLAYIPTTSWRCRRSSIMPTGIMPSRISSAARHHAMLAQRSPHVARLAPPCSRGSRPHARAPAR